MQVPKNETPCPFILRRGWCLKGEQCDFSHRNMVNNDQARQHSNDKKGFIFCPFLRRKGYCLKESRCDFSHVEPYSCPTGNHPVTNDNLQRPQLQPFLGSLKINQVEVICITESWLNTSVVDSMISLSNFIQFRNDRTYSCGGGVCIYIKEEIYCRRLEHFEDPAI
jgi:hypothetical protein